MTPFMKALLFAAGIISFVLYRSEKMDNSLHGTWEGRYKSIEKMFDVKIVFGQNNSIELYSNDLKINGKTTGTYTLSKNNEIEIITNQSNENAISYIMNGQLSPKRNFVNGNWQSGNNASGSFYIAKAGL
jgi:hypothetical protein